MLGVLKSITSLSNEKVKEAVRLKRKRHRYERRQFLAEGEDLLEAALKCGIAPRQVFVLEGREGEIERNAGGAPAAIARQGRYREGAPTALPAAEIYSCSAAVMAKLSELGSGSRSVVVFEMVDSKFPGGFKFPGGQGGQVTGQEESPPAGPVLYLAGIGDPGNVGTLIRAAAALGAAAAVLGPDTADPYSAKALRATMGAIFQIPLFLTVNPETIVAWAEKNDLPVICADAHKGGVVWDADLARQFVLVLGSEREGVPHRLLDATSETIMIPQAAGTESINVAIAGAVILYEAMKQRSGFR